VTFAGIVTVELPVVRLEALAVAATTGAKIRRVAPAVPATLGRILTDVPDTEMTVPASAPVEPAAVVTGMPG
jgi:hypothetical protein